MEHRERVLVGHQVDKRKCTVVVLLVPRFQLVLLKEQAHLRLNALIPLLKSEKALLACRQSTVGEGKFKLE